MSYNGGLEDPQSWPFSVRYTASPYRKSKFPVDASVKTTTGTSSSSSSSGGTRDAIVPSSELPSSSASSNLTQQHHQYQFQPSQQHHPHWLTGGPQENDASNSNNPSSWGNRGVPNASSSSSAVINPSAINRSANNNATTHQLGNLFPLHQVVPHHQANQPLFAQALVNYHNTQNSSSSGSNGSANFRHHLHNQHHQRQLQFQRGGGGVPSASGGGLATAAGSGRVVNNLSIENSSHLHQLHNQYQNQERQRQIQQRLLLNGSAAGGPGSGHNLHPFLISGQGSFLHSGKNSVHPDHHHYGLPMSSGGGSAANSGGTQQQPGGLMGSQVLARNAPQNLRQGNPVWHLLTENKDLDQVEGLDEGYIEDLKQPFLFHHHQQHPNQQQINSSSIKQSGGVLSLQQPSSSFPTPSHFPQPGVPIPTNFPQHHQPHNFLSSSKNGISIGGVPNSSRNDHLPFFEHSSADRNNTNLDYDPYSYVYDSQVQDDLSRSAVEAELRNFNNFDCNANGDIVGFNGTEFPNKVILAATLSNTSSLQGLPPSIRTGFGGAPTATTAGSSAEVSENEYEEIQDVARYMNSASVSLSSSSNNNPEGSDLLINGGSGTKKAGSIYSSSSPDDNYEYDSVHPNYDDVGGLTSKSEQGGQAESMNLAGGEGEVSGSNSSNSNSNSNNNSGGTSSNDTGGGGRRSPPLGPPRHFKSFSSTDDILAEVVQVQQKHDRVLDQLNLEVENLLIRSTKQEIEQNELNCQRSQIMLRTNIHSHSHQQGDLSQCLGPNCYCNQSQNQGSGSGGSGSCQDQNQEQQMSSGTEVGNLSSMKGEGSNIEVGGGDTNNGIGSSCNCCCCCGCCSASGDNNGNSSAVAFSSGGKDKGSNSSSNSNGSSWTEALKASLLSGFHPNHSHGQHHHNIHHLHLASGGGASKMKNGIETASPCENKVGNGSSATNVSGGVGGVVVTNGNGTFSRKKKLDRNAPGQLSDTNLKHKLNTLSAIQNHHAELQLLKDQQKSSSSCASLCIDECSKGVGKNMNVIHTLHHHNPHGAGVVGIPGKGGWKGRYQRSHSLIPSWKIRDHLMRLPFLRQHKDKLKKGDGLTGSSCSSLHTASSSAAPSLGAGVTTNNTNGGSGTSIPKSISGVDFSSSNPSSSLLLGGYNKSQIQQQHCHNHHHHHHPLLHFNGNHAVSSCLSQSNHYHQLQHNHPSKNIMSSGDGSTAAATSVPTTSCNTTTCSLASSSSASAAAVNNNPNLKLLRSSSMDELRPTEEHWYSADSDTEPDSLTGIVAPPQSASSNNIDNCCNNNGNPSCASSSTSGADLSNNGVTVIDKGQNVNGGGNCCGSSGESGGDNNICCGQHQNHHLHQNQVKSINGGGSCHTVGNIYTNSPNGVGVNVNNNSGVSNNVNSGNCVTVINGCGGGVGGVGIGLGSTENGHRMDVVGSAIISDVPKAPKFRRGTQGLKDKWRESWSHSKTMSKNNLDEDNRLLRWFSLRKNSATLDPSGGTTNHRHSTLPQLTEEDLKRISFMEDEEGYWPRRTVQPPSLPPPPPDLSSDQITRRHIVAAIVHSENSYVAALQRLVNEYKKPLECSHPAMLSHSKISSIFHRVPEILQCHSLFRIALAECVRRWDTEEKIGDVFVASFSKSLVLDVYSEFINNFGTAMETAKLEARRKSAFAEFLKVKQMTAHDRLSLFGLMVKPVQRFPQFILLLQDLLKHTPRDHHDRMSLQLALTQLESLAAMLNERKRESEQYQAFKETIKSIGGGKFVLLRNVMDDPNRILLRQDVVTQLEFDSNGGTVAKSKCRKLLLLNDMLICTTLPNTNSSSLGDHNLLNRKNSSGTLGPDDSTSHNGSSNGSSSGKAEKCMFKWSFPVREVEVEDISISPTMSRFVQSSGGNKGNKATPEDTASIVLLEEMQSLMHDYEVLSRVLTLVQSLKSAYEGLTEATVKELMLEIQYQIQRRDEQISYFDSSCLTLLLGAGNNKEKVIFQMQSPQARNEWIEELRLAQLALDPSNSPAWDIPLESPYPLHKLPLFVRALPVCKSPLLTTVKCGCYFTHTFVSQTGRSKILDYLWVSSTDGMSSHITAFRSQQNALKEVSSFDLVEEKVNDLLFVMGHIWMGTESRKIMVYDPSDPDKGNIGHYLLSDSVIKLTLYNNTIYAGLADGNLAVFTELGNPTKNLRPEVVVKLGSERITSIFGSRDSIYAACGNAVVSIDAKTHIIERNVVLTHHNGPISHMACSGVGLWIATHESGTVCLYHLESLQHLQDVSIAPSVFRTVRDSFRRQKGVYVTCLMAHKGWLWIGTNLGVVLTIPLPRLEGVPIISTGNANVSFHGFIGPVSFLMPLMKPPTPSLLPLTQKQQHHHHQTNKLQKKEMKEITRNGNDVVKDDAYIEMSSPISPPSLNSTKSLEPVVISSDEMVTGELCLSSMSSNSNNNEEKVSSVSFSTNIDDSITSKEIDVADYVNAVPTINNNNNNNNSGNYENDEDQKHDSLPSVSSPECSSFNQIVSQIDHHHHGSSASAGSDRSSCNSMERGVTPISSASSPSTSVSNSKTLVVLRKKSSKDNVFLRNCKTLPRGGPIPSRFSIESDVYGLYGNLINVRGLEDEGRFVDPLYDALRRSDPELNALDAKINTLDRRLKMRMSRPRSLDLSNWSVDSKISASSDESVGLGSRSSQQTTDSNAPTAIVGNNNISPLPPSGEVGDGGPEAGKERSTTVGNNNSGNTATTKKTMARQKHKSVKGPQERTVLVVVGGRGYLNMRTQPHPDHFLSSNMESESKSCTHLTLWQMKT